MEKVNPSFVADEEESTLTSPVDHGSEVQRPTLTFLHNVDPSDSHEAASGGISKISSDKKRGSKSTIEPQPSNQRCSSCGSVTILMTDLQDCGLSTQEESSPAQSSNNEEGSDELLYSIEENPPWYLALVLGLQHYLTMAGSTVTIPFIITPALCILPDDPVRGYILSTIFFVSGIITLLQSTLGTRLPIVQGATVAFIPPTFAILQTSFASCESLNLRGLTEAQQQEEWQMRMREVQGAIIVSSLFQILIGFSGLIGTVVRFITPLVIAPTVGLIGLSMLDVAVDKASKHWGIACLTIVMMVLFSQYLRNVAIPVPVCRKGGMRFAPFKVFGLFPVLLTILLSWALCGILTVSGALSEDSEARTDIAKDLIANSPWVRVPYPGQWGTPTVSAAGVFGMLAGVLASILESVGDYYACARLSGAPPPPRHAINRGVGTEGVGCLLAGAWGTGNATTSYSENIGAIGLTKVGSRRVIQIGALIMIAMGLFGKFSAAIVTIPEPVVGGIFCIMSAMVTAVGISSLQSIDLNSSRNLFVLGFPLFFGLALPKWLEHNPDVIHWDAAPQLAQIVTVLLKTSMFVGGFLGMLLDNTIPGTDKERGLLVWKRQMEESEGEAAAATRETYGMPCGMSLIRRVSFFEKVPFCPTFKGWKLKKRT